jgi:membrane associated rhomboid family serine protease
MLTILVALTIVFFFGMRLIGLVAPERVSVINGVPELTREGRNEVRAVYGGFGIAIAVVLSAAWLDPGLRPGVAIAVAAALLGMAAGRLVAALIERPTRFYPSWFYCAVESAMAFVLIAWSSLAGT